MGNMEKILPETVQGWKRSGEDERYSPHSLFTFINGGAELYLSFGFKELLVRRFEKANSPRLEIDLFDMGSPANAFGIFRHDLQDEEVGIGQGSEYGAGWLRFWKGSYYVYMYAEAEGPAVKQTLLDLGNYIARKIQKPGSEPKLVSKIPQEGVIPKSLRFFHNHACLNYYYYLASENILRLSEKTNAIFVKYRSGDHKVPLILVQYENPSQAQKAYESFLASYLPEANEGDIVQIENGKWAGGIRRDRYLIIVLDGTTSMGVRRLIEETVKSLGVR